MGLAFTEVVVVIVIILFKLLPFALIAWALWKVLGRNSRISALESRVEQLEQERRIERRS